MKIMINAENTLTRQEQNSVMEKIKAIKRVINTKKKVIKNIT